MPCQFGKTIVKFAPRTYDVSGSTSHEFSPGEQGLNLHNSHAIRIPVSTSCLARSYCNSLGSQLSNSVDVFSLPTSFPALCMLDIKDKASTLVSVCPSTNMLSATVGSYVPAQMGNKEKEQYPALLWRFLEPSLPTTHRVVSYTWHWEFCLIIMASRIDIIHLSRVPSYIILNIQFNQLIE